MGLLVVRERFSSQCIPYDFSFVMYETANHGDSEFEFWNFTYAMPAESMETPHMLLEFELHS